MRELNLSPYGPGKKGVNTAKSNKDGSVTLNETAVLDKEGQSRLFDTKYEYTEGSPYLDKYGDYYANKEGMRTKGRNLASFDEGYVSFKDKAYNKADQEKIFDKMRSNPRNKGLEFYLKGSTNPKYAAPSGWQYRKEEVNPLNSIK